uniref:Lipase n=1 Tax=Steinernema glaseri TaxID=37863 RepID=A0A1I8A087_9BILA
MYVPADADEVEQVKVFTYLGQEIRMPRDHSNEVSRRIRSGWNVFRQHKNFFTSRTVDMRWKRRLFNMCVLPAMLYGAETWALTEAAQEKLAVAQRKMERRMVGRLHFSDKSSSFAPQMFDINTGLLIAVIRSLRSGCG